MDAEEIEMPVRDADLISVLASVSRAVDRLSLAINSRKPGDISTLLTAQTHLNEGFQQIRNAIDDARPARSSTCVTIANLTAEQLTTLPPSPLLRRPSRFGPMPEEVPTAEELREIAAARAEPGPAVPFEELKRELDL